MLSLIPPFARKVGAAVALTVLALGGVAVAAESPDRTDELAIDPTACAQWGDLLPVELSRATAREAIGCLINEQRLVAGREALLPNRRLQRASQRHTERMNGTSCFLHRCPGERRLKRRLYRYLSGSPSEYLFGETIAWQPERLATPRQIVAQLLESPIHRFHVLRLRYEEMGVGFTVGTPASALEPGGIYTVDFGMRRE